MSRGFLVLDLETVPDPALYTPPPQPTGVEKPFPPIYAHRPIVIGVLWLDENYAFKRLGVIGENKDEAGQLADFAAFMAKERPLLVTYNGRGFDVPVLTLRCLRHGVPLAFTYDGAFRHRYSDGGHLDLHDNLSDHGATRGLSLDMVARIIGLPGKVGVDGSQVEGLFQTGQLEAIKNYCLSDVAQTAFLLLRFRLLQGLISAERYKSAAAELLDHLVADPRLAPLTSKIERARLLLES